MYCSNSEILQNLIGWAFGKYFSETTNIYGFFLCENLLGTFLVEDIVGGVREH
jgi:hypothetical protein